MRKDILDTLKQEPPVLSPPVPVVPIMMHYPTIFKAGSLYNTLPIFDVYIAGLTMEKLIKDYGGGDDVIEGQEKVSDQKAKLAYDILDKYPKVFTVVPEKNVRSRMNICFTISDGKEAEYLKGAADQGLQGLKGHRSVGGIRISNCKFCFPF